MRYETTIPFSGFYNSLHDSELDMALRDMFSDRATGTDVNEDLLQRAMEKMNWRGAYVEYAKEYADDFGRWLELDLEFDELSSPREYNFTTDRIFVKISEESLKSAFAKVLKPELREAVRERFTSYDGFISFYNPDMDSWPEDVTEWDANQIGTLLIVLANQECTNNDGFEVWDEYDLMDDTRGNGIVDDILYRNCPGVERLLKIRDYLEDRKERV